MALTQVNIWTQRQFSLSSSGLKKNIFETSPPLEWTSFNSSLWGCVLICQAFVDVIWIRHLALRELSHDARKASLHHSFPVHLTVCLPWLLASPFPGDMPRIAILLVPLRKLRRSCSRQFPQWGIGGWGWQKDPWERAHLANYTNTAAETESRRVFYLQESSSSFLASIKFVQFMLKKKANKK